MSFLRVRGLVTAKRKRADGQTHFSVRSSLVVTVDKNNDQLPNGNEILTTENYSSRCFQLIQSDSTTLYPIELGHANILSLSSSQSTVEGYGCLQERPSDQRITLHLKSLKVIRVAIYPQHVKFVVDLAQRPAIQNSDTLMSYINSLVSPAELSAPPVHYIQRLLSNEITVKSHCHFLTDYRSCSSRSAPKQQKDGNYRAPRRRVRKVGEDERRAVQALELQVEKKLSTVMEKYQVHVKCLFEESEQVDLCDNTCHAEAEEKVLLNIPANDTQVKSHRGSLTRGEYLHGKKEPQVQWVTSRLFGLIAESGVTAASDCVHVLDVGGGRGDLGVAIALELQRQGYSTGRVRVVDINAKSLAAGRVYADMMGVGAMMSFEEMDFEDVRREKGDQPLNLFVVALHACGSLSDMVLKYAAHRCMGFCVVPCCYSKISPVLSYDSWIVALTEDSGSDYCMSCDVQNASESHAERDKSRNDDVDITASILGRVAESEPRHFSWKAMRGINALRLCRLCEMSSYSGNERSWHVGLELFSNKYSMRNMVVVGTRIQTHGTTSANIRNEYLPSVSPHREMIVNGQHLFDNETLECSDRVDGPAASNSQIDQVL